MSDALKTIILIVGLFGMTWAALDGATRRQVRQPDCCACDGPCECKSCRCCEACK